MLQNVSSRVSTNISGSNTSVTAEKTTNIVMSTDSLQTDICSTDSGQDSLFSGMDINQPAQAKHRTIPFGMETSSNILQATTKANTLSGSLLQPTAVLGKKQPYDTRPYNHVLTPQVNPTKLQLQPNVHTSTMGWPAPNNQQPLVPSVPTNAAGPMGWSTSIANQQPLVPSVSSNAGPMGWSTSIANEQLIPSLSTNAAPMNWSTSIDKQQLLVPTIPNPRGFSSSSTSDQSRSTKTNPFADLSFLD